MGRPINHSKHSIAMVGRQRSVLGVLQTDLTHNGPVGATEEEINL